MKQSWFVAMGIAAAAGCGSPGAGDDASDDDSTADAAAPDAAQCAPGVPTALAMAHDTTDSPSSIHDVLLTSTGEVAMLYWPSTGGEAARVWNGSGWAKETVYATSNGGASMHAFGEMDGHVVALETVDTGSSDDGKLRYFAEVAGGQFATPAVMPDVTYVVANGARYTPSDGLLSATGSDAQQLYFFQHPDGGSWVTQWVHQTSGASVQIYGAGAGMLDDGTAVAASYGNEGLWLHRRVGATWSQYRNLTADNTNEGAVVFPPDGTTGHAVATWNDQAQNHLHGAFASTADGTASGTTELMSSYGGWYTDVAYAPDGQSGTILVWESIASHAYTIEFTGTSFLPAQELRPDLVFEARPRLIQHPCGGLMILHVTRAATDPAGSADAVLEPLADFQ